jgi:hypothetical protein
MVSSLCCPRLKSTLISVGCSGPTCQSPPTEVGSWWATGKPGLTALRYCRNGRPTRGRFMNSPASENHNGRHATGGHETGCGQKKSQAALQHCRREMRTLKDLCAVTRPVMAPLKRVQERRKTLSTISPGARRGPAWRREQGLGVGLGPLVPHHTVRMLPRLKCGRRRGVFLGRARFRASIDMRDQTSMSDGSPDPVPGLCPFSYCMASSFAGLCSPAQTTHDSTMLSQ